MTAVLEALEIRKTFSGIVALDDLSISVDEGERVGLIGPNGAGKTTFFNCVLGVLRPDAGRVHLHGEDVSGLRVHRRAQRGIGRTFQRIELFAELTVREHLLIAERTRRGDGRLWKDLIGRGKPRADEIARCDDVLGLLGLGDVATEPIEHLSLGKGRLVEVGRALMTQPSILLLDEPSSGLDRQETADLARTLREVQAEQGFAILLVEHDVEFVASFTERAYVLDFGGMIAEGPTAEVLQRDIVRSAYLGDVGDGDVTAVLDLHHVSAGYGPFRALFDVKLTVEPGQAVALLGPNGVGKTTVARVATGLVVPTDGLVVVDGVDMTGVPVHRFRRAGIIHAPEGRSVFATLTVDENLVLSFRASRGRREVPAALDRAFTLFPALASRRRQVAGTLSGGEQRMLAMARVLVEEPKLLVADELSLGLAPKIVDEVYESLDRLRATGTSLLIVEQHVGHALALCDQVVLLDHGTIGWEGAAADAVDRVVTTVFATE